MLDRLQRTSYALWKEQADRAAEKQTHLLFALERAQIPVLPAAYLALTWTVALGAFVIGFALSLLVLVAAVVGDNVSIILVAVLFFATTAAAGAVYTIFAVYPDFRVYRRRRGIEDHLGYAVNYMAAMAAAGTQPAFLFRDIAKQPLYKDVADECRWISRDMDLFGRDLVTALDNGIRRTPSPRMEEFLQGAKTTITAGGDLRDYLVRKADQLLLENRQRQRDFLEGLGVISESYVTVVIAGPLFLSVMLTVMMLFGGGPTSALLFSFSLVFLLLPISHIAFMFAVKSSGGS